MIPIRAVLLLGFIYLFSACLPSAPTQAAPPPAPTSTTVILYSQPQIDTTATPAFDGPTEAVGQSPQPTVDCEQSGETDSAIRYDISAELDYAARQIVVEQTTAYRNTTGDVLQALVLLVPPNKQPDVFSLEEVTLPDAVEPLTAALEGVRLTLDLPEPLAPECVVSFTLDYSLTIPRMGTIYFPRQGYLGFSDRQINLGLWTPTIAHYTHGRWLTPTPFHIGEQTVSPTADYHVSLSVRNAPANLTIAAPGTITRTGRGWDFSLLQARDFVLSLSNQYIHDTAISENGVQVDLYAFEENLENGNGPASRAHALNSAATALDLYSDLYGPYPYDRMVIVQGDFPDGMEFSGLVFVGGEWFRNYTGDPAGYLTLITVHEISHQWWYHAVANDQSLSPWLDEALATYSEYVFLQENYPDLTDWWWEFRVNGFDPHGFVDSTIYEFDRNRTYINAVYLRGAQFMHALRSDLGTETFFDWINTYIHTMRGSIAQPADLWGVLSEEERAKTARTRATYLRSPEG